MRVGGIWRKRHKYPINGSRVQGAHGCVIHYDDDNDYTSQVYSAFVANTTY